MPEPRDHSTQAKNRRTAKALLVSAGTAAIVTVFGVAGAQAFTPNVQDNVEHFIECFGWMLTDPDTHAQNCLPGHIPPLETLAPAGPPEIIPSYD